MLVFMHFLHFIYFVMHKFLGTACILHCTLYNIILYTDIETVFHTQGNNIVTSYNFPRVDASVNNTWRTFIVWPLNRRDFSVHNTWRTLIVWPLNRRPTLRHVVPDAISFCFLTPV